MILQRCPRLTEAARAGELSAALLSPAAEPRAGGTEREFLALNLETEVVAELDTRWAVSVKKWRCGKPKKFFLVGVARGHPTTQQCEKTRTIIYDATAVYRGC